MFTAFISSERLVDVQILIAVLKKKKKNEGVMEVLEGKKYKVMISSVMSGTR